MTTTIYFHETLIQHNARGNSERTGDAWRNRERRARPNSEIKKSRIRLTMTKMQAKNFDLKLLSLHPNWGHGTPESALGNSPRVDPCPTLIRLKETDHEISGSQSLESNHASRKAVPAQRTRVSNAVPTPETQRVELVSAAERNASRRHVPSNVQEQK